VALIACIIESFIRSGAAVGERACSSREFRLKGALAISSTVLTCCFFVLVSGCYTHLAEREVAPYAGLELPMHLNVLSWNVAKGDSAAGAGEIRREIQSLISGRNINVACLQEATEGLIPEAGGLGAHFGPNYDPMIPFPFFGGREAGVATLASTSPETARLFRSPDRELLLFTPKVALATTHRVRVARMGHFENLLVLNVHALNFSSVESVERQLQAWVVAIAAHTGPVVVCGDFNTWSEERSTQLTEHFQELGLEEVAFGEGRTTAPVWLLDSTPLDRMFVRGLEARTRMANGAAVGEVVPGDWASDHQPITASFRCCT
jgi:endonuclease/exonuclease/phosphatase (EEP) superfamily protein YafD